MTGHVSGELVEVYRLSNDGIGIVLSEVVGLFVLVLS